MDQRRKGFFPCHPPRTPNSGVSSRSIPSSSAPWSSPFCATALVLGLFIVGLTLWDNLNYAGVDLRNRVVGARVMLAGHDPYTFDWEPGMPDQWLDPVYDPKAHRLTASPPTLLLYAVGARLPFRVQRHLSFVIEWLALLASLMLLSASLPELRHRVAFLLGATLFIVAANAWHSASEAPGQLYVYLLLALSVAMALFRARLRRFISPRRRPRRPRPDASQPPPLRPGGARHAPMAVRAAPSPARSAPACWRPAWCSPRRPGGAIWTSASNIIECFKTALDPGPPASSGERSGRDGWEGVDFDAVIPDIESLLRRILASHGQALHVHERFGLPPLDVALTSKLVCAALAGLLLVMLLVRPGIDPHGNSPLAVVLSLDTEFFLPHRWVYADVVLLAPLALLLPEMLHDGKLPRAQLGGVLLGLVAGTMGTQLMPLYAATVLRPWLVMGSLTTLAIGMWHGER